MECYFESDLPARGVIEHLDSDNLLAGGIVKVEARILSSLDYIQAETDAFFIMAVCDIEGA